MRFASRRTLTTAALAASLVAGPFIAAPARAGDATSRTTYSVRFLGLPIARAEFTTEIEGRTYRISGTARSAGLAEIFDSIRASTQVSGIVKQDRLQARDYLVSYTSGKKKSRTGVTFRNGDVTATSQEPKEKKHGDDWVALSGADLRDVLDPVSGLIVPTGTPVCPRTIAVFDGETRADIELSPTGRQPFSTNGFKGEAIACSVRFVPKAGYRRNNSSIKYLKAASMEVWFARSPSADVFAPVYARVPTKIGSVTVWATRFGG